MKYMDGVIAESEVFNYKMDLLIEYPVVFSVLLFGALMIELTSSFALFNKKTRILYGLLLLSMHIGIWYLFHIKITAFIYPVLIFLLNPLYLFLRLFTKKKFST